MVIKGGEQSTDLLHQLYWKFSRCYFSYSMCFFYCKPCFFFFMKTYLFWNCWEFRDLRKNVDLYINKTKTNSSLPDYSIFSKRKSIWHILLCASWTGIDIEGNTKGRFCTPVNPRKFNYAHSRLAFLVSKHPDLDVKMTKIEDQVPLYMKEMSDVHLSFSERMLSCEQLLLTNHTGI